MKRTKYNPREPVTIHNPYPQKLWPFREGTPVWFIDNRGCPELCAGRMQWYNPALKGTRLTVGQPICTINIAGGSSYTVTTDEIAAKTKAGKKKLLLYLAGRHRASARSYERQRTAAVEEADRLETEARSL